MRTNDAVRIDLDDNKDGEDANFQIVDKDDNIIFDVDESGEVYAGGSAIGARDAAPLLFDLFSALGDTRSARASAYPAERVPRRWVESTLCDTYGARVGAETPGVRAYGNHEDECEGTN